VPKKRQYAGEIQIRRILLQASDRALNRFFEKICFVATKSKYIQRQISLRAYYQAPTA
jgi:hypothetical protein